MVRRWVWLALLLALGCPRARTPLGAFMVTSVTPAARIVAVGETFTIRFSDEVDGAGVNGDTVVLVPTERVNASFLSDLNNPPLSQTRRSSIVPVQLTPSGNSINV